MHLSARRQNMIEPIALKALYATILMWTLSWLVVHFSTVETSSNLAGSLWDDWEAISCLLTFRSLTSLAPSTAVSFVCSYSLSFSFRTGYVVAPYNMDLFTSVSLMLYIIYWLDTKSGNLARLPIPFIMSIFLVICFVRLLLTSWH